MKNEVGELRRSAAIATYPPGAVVDMRSGGAPVSGVTGGLDEWPSEIQNVDRIFERRLSIKLGKKFFRLPPVTADKRGNDVDPAEVQHLAIARFPGWLQCPVCDTLKYASAWGLEPGKAARFCAECTDSRPGKNKVFVAPVRFVTACESGHLDDFPWDSWIKHKETCMRKKSLKLKSRSPGLGGLVLTCDSCDAEKSLQGVFSKTALAGFNCQGRMPWLRNRNESCEHSGHEGTYRVMQRGASNLYYSVTESALDIPPWTKNLQRVLADYWQDLMDVAGTPTEIRDQRIRMIESIPTLRRAIEREKLTTMQAVLMVEDAEKILANSDSGNLRQDEYRVFRQLGSENDREFVTRPYSPNGLLSAYFDVISQVPRLREVRVVTGFTRINPPESDDSKRIAKLSVQEFEWLPAIEVRGEGIFLGFSEEKMKRWESQAAVRDRVKIFKEAVNPLFRPQAGEKDEILSPRVLLIHTFAHLLINQLSLECGYSSAALRERLYVSTIQDSCGVLIYTGTTDSDGTLGGLQARGSSALLEASIVAALKNGEWCSSDPLCIEGEMTLPDSFSLASCHSCSMAPETSCELNNRYLDRALLVGDGVTSGLGYFEGIVR